MAKKFSRRTFRWILALVAITVIGFFGFRYWKAKQGALPEGITSGNGRLEATLVDVAAKEALRVKEILVDEGALVTPDQVLVKLDTVTLEAQLVEANANVATAQERLAVAKASIVKQKNEISLAQIEVQRSGNLVRESAGSQQDLDVRKTKLATTKATLAEAQAVLQTATQQVEVSKANAATLQTRIDDATLKSPITGRVLYRLAEPGEVLAPGGKALTLVNLQDVHMEIFLPAGEAARLAFGSEARITLDYNPSKVVPAYVSFVSPEAQFTPKQVETLSERERLMFRVKLQVPKELASHYLEQIKTGVRGIGYVKVQASAVWPERLQNLVASPPQTH